MNLLERIFLVYSPQLFPFLFFWKMHKSVELNWNFENFLESNFNGHKIIWKIDQSQKLLTKSMKSFNSRKVVIKSAINSQINFIQKEVSIKASNYSIWNSIQSATASKKLDRNENLWVWKVLQLSKFKSTLQFSFQLHLSLWQWLWAWLPKIIALFKVNRAVADAILAAIMLDIGELIVHRCENWWP